VTDPQWWDGPGHYLIGDVTIGGVKARRERWVLARTPADLLRECPWLELEPLRLPEDTEPDE
jgi:hypothetical protein